MGYSDDFRYDLAVGNAAENEFSGILKNSLVEVKYDLQAHRTGNEFIEFESRGEPSGIATTRAQWWTFKIDDTTFITIGVDELKDRCRQIYKDRGSITGGDSQSSKGILLPIRKLISK